MQQRALIILFSALIWLTRPGTATQANLLSYQIVGNQGTLSFDTFEVDLWPEYDQPSMLVIYHMFLAAGTPLPATLSLHIPATAGDPYNVASRQSDGQLYNMAFNRTVQGNLSQVTFTTTSLEIQFEYYDPGINTSEAANAYPILKKGNNQRAYTFTWGGDYTVKTMNIQVQQPLGASQMTITPSLGSGTAGEGGLIYFNGSIGSVPARTTFKVSLSYVKPNDNLSAASLKVSPSAPITPQTPGRTFNLMDYLPWVLGGLGVILAVGGGIWYRSTSHEERVLNGRRQRAPRIKLSKDESSERIYCHQCGKQAGPDDIFCRSCGTRLRRE